jgi:hypothetical protein
VMDRRAMVVVLLSTFGLKRSASCGDPLRNKGRFKKLVVESGFPDWLKIAVALNTLILRYLNAMAERE